MVERRLIGLLASATALAAFSTSPALSQESPGGEDAAAGEHTSYNGDSNEIIVTATRRDQNLSDVPIAISAHSQELLENAQIENTIDLAAVTPGLAVARQAGGQIIFLRGVGSADASAGQEAAVATYIDGVYIAAPRMAFTQFNNVDHIEVLKGPQGTLFGRNATGGLVHVITRRPSHDPSLEASLAFGSYQTLGGRLYASTGLAPGVAADIAVTFQEQGEGYGTNLGTGREVGFEEWFGIRSRWELDLGETTRVTLIGDYSSNRNRIDHRALLPGVLGIDGVTTAPEDFQDTATGVDPRQEVEAWGISGRLDQEIGSLALVSITAFRNGTSYQQFDNDMTTLSVTDVLIDERFRTFTQEVQLQSAPDRNLTWIIGGFYMWDRNGNRDPIGLGLFGSGFNGGVGINNVIHTNSYSAFGEFTYRLAERLRVTAGARYTVDERRISGRTDLYDSSYVDYMVRPNRGPATPFMTVPLAPRETSFSDPSYRVILDYTTPGDILTYASYSRGFKSGNFNAVSGNSPAFRPETIDAFEIGAKGNILQRRLRFGIAAYYYDYKDLQLPISNGTTIITANAAESEIYGVDLELNASIGERLVLNAGAAWVHARYVDYPNARCTERLASGRNTAFVCDVSGNSISRTPEWTFNLGGTYTIPTSVGEFTANAVWSYNDGFSWDADDRLSEPAFHIVNASIAWRSDDDRWGISLFGRNLLDEEYRLYVNALDIGDLRSVAPPRTYGVELSARY